MALAYYNEIDPYAAQWLRNLIKAGHIANGIVDERDIRDVTPNELKAFTQCHFFAGVGVWSRALRSAGWPDDKPVWTGSCPCQPFSTAGSKAGFADERHLWPHWQHLIAQCLPSRIYGEQVASKNVLPWLDLVQTDLEGTGYAFRAVDLCAAGVGAPHIRQRLWFNAERLGHSRCPGLSDSKLETLGGTGRREEGGTVEQSGGAFGGMANSDSAGSLSRIEAPEADGYGGTTFTDGSRMRPSPTNGFWADVDWLFCRDGKWRPVESGTFPLAHGATSRVVFNCAHCKTEVISNHEMCNVRTINGRNERREPSEVLLSILHGKGVWGGPPSDVRSLLERVYSASQEEQNLFCPVCEGVGAHKCEKEMASRVGVLKAYGNAINLEAAKTFIEST